MSYREFVLLQDKTLAEIPNQMLQSLVSIYSGYLIMLYIFCCILLQPHSTESSTATYLIVVAEVLTFLFAGQDSTAAAMASCLCFLTASPRCKAKLLQEPGEKSTGGRGLDGSGGPLNVSLFSLCSIFFHEGPI